MIPTVAIIFLGWRSKTAQMRATSWYRIVLKHLVVSKYEADRIHLWWHEECMCMAANVVTKSTRRLLSASSAGHCGLLLCPWLLTHGPTTWCWGRKWMPRPSTGSAEGRKPRIAPHLVRLPVRYCRHSTPPVARSIAVARMRRPTSPLRAPTSFLMGLLLLLYDFLAAVMLCIDQPGEHSLWSLDHRTSETKSGLGPRCSWTCALPMSASSLLLWSWPRCLRGSKHCLGRRVSGRGDIRGPSTASDHVHVNNGHYVSPWSTPSSSPSSGARSSCFLLLDQLHPAFSPLNNALVATVVSGFLQIRPLYVCISCWQRAVAECSTESQL